VGFFFKLLSLWAHTFASVLLFGFVCLSTLSTPHAQTINPGQGPLSGIVDRAELFATPERTQMRIRLARIAERLGTDIFVVTIDDTAQQWKSMPTHRAMVQRAFQELDTTRQSAVATKRSLTAVVVFKRNPILHYTSSLRALDATLYASKFYSGFEAAAFKLRDKTETAGHAAVRYLDQFEKATELGGRVDLAALNPYWGAVEPAIKFVAVFVSREFWSTLDWIVGIGPVWGKVAFGTTLDVITKAAGLGMFALYLLGTAAAMLGYLIRRLIGRILSPFVNPNRYVVGGIKAAVILPIKFLIFGPILAATYTIATYDVENIVFLAERYGMPIDVLLDRAKDAHEQSFDLTWTAVFVGALVLMLLDALMLWRENARKSGRDSGDGEYEKLGTLAFLKTWALTAAAALALGLLPGVAAAFGYAYLFLERALRILFASRGVHRTSSHSHLKRSPA
jgi:hypothetical protein